MSHFVYILKCADKTLYVGCTNDLEKRIKQHNESKRGAHYTKIRRPVKLLYSEKYPTKSEALKREIQIKRWKRNKKLALVNFNKKAKLVLSGVEGTSPEQFGPELIAEGRSRRIKSWRRKKKLNFIKFGKPMIK